MALTVPPNATACAGDLQLATPVTERSARHVERGGSAA